MGNGRLYSLLGSYAVPTLFLHGSTRFLSPMAAYKKGPKTSPTMTWARKLEPVPDTLSHSSRMRNSTSQSCSPRLEPGALRKKNKDRKWSEKYITGNTEYIPGYSDMGLHCTYGKELTV